MTPEKIVQNAIIDYLHTLQKQGYKVFVERRQAGGFSYKMGEADLYAVVNGRHIEIEVKSPGKQLRPMQEKWRDKCIAMNIDHICADSIDQFKAFILDKIKQYS